MPKYDHEVGIANDIMTSAKKRLEDELGRMGFSVSGSVHQAPYQDSRPTTLLITASLNWDGMDNGYTLTPPKVPAGASICSDDEHEWHELSDADGEPYDQCKVCKTVAWL